VDLFKGFQQEPEEPFRLRNWNDPETGRSVDPAEVGGLHLGRRQCIVVMHESGLVLRVDKFGDLIVQLGETQVERLDGLTIFISDIIVFP
jgi:hypothetical protein